MRNTIQVNQKLWNYVEDSADVFVRFQLLDQLQHQVRVIVSYQLITHIIMQSRKIKDLK